MQYDGTSTTDIAALSWTWDDARNELAAFRFLDRQVRLRATLADPNWAFELSRRWTLLQRGGVQLFFGFGFAYKTETDALNGSRWNFAEQFGWRIPQAAGQGQLEFAQRHISNAGLKQPNKGQDFITLAYHF